MAYGHGVASRRRNVLSQGEAQTTSLTSVENGTQFYASAVMTRLKSIVLSVKSV